MEELGRAAPQRLLRKSSTYLAKIAVALQRAPHKMLTFSQLMEELMPLMSDNRRSFENNIRVCLSTNKCFVKIPLVPGSPESKRNYWKLDPARITAKMVRRHFKGLLQLFPELVPRVLTENGSAAPGAQATLKGPQAAGCRGENRREAKFSGPFSIESLLRRDGPSATTSRASPLGAAQVRAEQRPGFGTMRSLARDPEEALLLRNPPGHYPMCSAGGSTHRGLAQWAVPSRTSAAPYFPSPPSSYIGYVHPAFSHDALHFRL